MKNLLGRHLQEISEEGRIPVEIEQRWLVDPKHALELIRRANSSSLIYQGKLDPRGTHPGKSLAMDVKHAVEVDEEATPPTAAIRIWTGLIPLLELPIPLADARQLQAHAEWLDKIRFRLEEHVGSGERRGTLTIKGKKVDGVLPEYEYEIAIKDAAFMLQHFCKNKLVRKERYYLDDGVIIDHFPTTDNYIAEREVKDKGDFLAQMPYWASADITTGAHYSNFKLAGSKVDPAAVRGLGYILDSCRKDGMKIG